MFTIVVNLYAMHTKASQAHFTTPVVDVVVSVYLLLFVVMVIFCHSKQSSVASCCVVFS